jgi:hypothetical protein
LKKTVYTVFFFGIKNIRTLRTDIGAGEGNRTLAISLEG